MGYWSDGVALFQHATRVTKDNYVAHYDLGLELSARQRYDEAIRQFAKSLTIDPTFIPPLEALGMIRVHRGELDQAVKVFEILSDMKPENQHFRKYLSKLEKLKAQKGLP